MKAFLKNICLVTKATLALGIVASCGQNSALQSPEASIAPRFIKPSEKQREQASAKVMLIIHEVSRISNDSGLNGMVIEHDWQGLDTYYQRVDKLPCQEMTKSLLKSRALYGLVKSPDFLKNASLEKREYYADQLLAQAKPQPDLVVSFLENLKSHWSPEKVARVKAQAGQLLSTSLENNKSFSTGASAALTQNPTAQKRNEQKKEDLVALQQKLSNL